MANVPLHQRADGKLEYERLRDKDVADGTWVQQFVHPSAALKETGAGKGHANRKIFEAVLESFNDSLASTPQPKKKMRKTWSDAVVHNFGQVVQRRPQENNLIYTGAGNSLHSLTTDECKYLSPFLLVARAWLAKQTNLLHSHSQYVGFVEEAVVAPLFKLAYTFYTVRCFPFEFQMDSAENLYLTNTNSSASK